MNGVVEDGPAGFDDISTSMLKLKASPSVTDEVAVEAGTPTVSDRAERAAGMTSLSRDAREVSVW